MIIIVKSYLYRLSCVATITAIITFHFSRIGTVVGIIIIYYNIMCTDYCSNILAAIVGDKAKRQWTVFRRCDEYRFSRVHRTCRRRR